MNTDLKIAQAAVLEPIDKIAHKAGIPEEYLEMYGKEKAKVSIKLMETPLFYFILRRSANACASVISSA